MAYLVLLGVAIVANCFLLVVLYRNTQKNVIIITLMILLTLVVIWFGPKFITNLIQPKGLTFETLSRISALGYVFVPGTFLTFALTYAGFNKLVRRFSYWFIITVPSIVFLYLSWTSNLVGVHEPSTMHFYAWGIETPTGPLWPIYIIWYDITMFVAMVILIYNYFRLDDSDDKKQALYIIIAVIIPLIVGSITTGILPIFNIFVFPIGLILLNLTAIIGVTLIYRYGWFVLTPWAILSSIDHVIITVDRNSNIVQLNPYSEKVLGVSAPNVTGKSVEKVLFLQNGGAVNDKKFGGLLEPVFRKGKSVSFDAFTVLNKKKRAFASTISITPIYEQREVIGANIFLRDSRKEQEQQKQKDDYFSMLSHELKTPITSIKAYNQLLIRRLGNINDEYSSTSSERSSSSSKNRDLVAKADDQVDRLTKIIDDFFELSRVQAGKLELEREFFGIDDFIFGLVDVLGVTYHERKFRVVGSSNSVVFADKGRIEQIVINLVNNAIKFSPNEAEIVIHIESGEEKVLVGVQDFGEGIDPKFKKKVFDRFFQLKNGKNEKASGLGVGLFIASTIVREHEGEIWVESKVGSGSTFWFSLPVSA